MIRPILKYGAPELQTQSTAIDRVDEEIRTLAQDMLETMYAAPGIGLAAPQVGVNLRLIVLDISGGEETGHQLILTNPEVTEQEGTQEAEGNPQEIDAEGLLARAICHEIDHLDGMLYLNRLSVLKRDLIKRKIRKLIRAGEW